MLLTSDVVHMLFIFNF